MNEVRKKITITEIASLANTSKTTVSFYLNGKFDKMSDDTKKRIKEVIEETNYRPNFAARSLNNMPTKTIGVLIGDITNGFSNKLVKGIDDEAVKNNYQIIIGSSSYDYSREAKYVERMIDSNVDGFIIQPTSNFKNIYPKIKAANKPVVFVDSYIKGMHIPCVKSNNHDIIVSTLTSAYNIGYDEFIIITAEPSEISVRKERLDAFREVVNNNNINNKEIFLPPNINDLNDNYFKGIVENSILPGKKNLIFVSNCWLLPKIFTSMKSILDKVPNKVGLVGFDNDEWINLISPSITSIIQPAYKEGHKAVETLLELIEDKDKDFPQFIEIESEVIVNDTLKI